MAGDLHISGTLAQLISKGKKMGTAIVFNPFTGLPDYVSAGGGGGGTTAGSLQQVVFETSDLASTALEIAPDYVTVPTSSDGLLWTSLPITPVSATSYLLIQGSLCMSVYSADAAQIALFIDSNVNASATYYQTAPDTQVFNIPFEFTYSPGSTDPLTVSLKFGSTNASGSSLVSINGLSTGGSASQVGNAATISTLTITEIATFPAQPFAITITGDNAAPQTGTQFLINGTQGFLFNWNGLSSAFDIVPPNTFVHEITQVPGTSATLQAGYSHILTNPSPTDLALPDNADTSVGDLIEIIGLSGEYTITQQANQQIYVGSTATTLGATVPSVSGYIQTTNSPLQNAITLRCVSNGAGVFLWMAVVSPQGIFNLF